MSSSVTPPPSFAVPAPPQQTATIMLTSPPPELKEFPVGTTLQGTIIPPETSADIPVLTIALPNNEQISVPLKIAHVPTSPVAVTLRILPPEIKDTLSLHLQQHMSIQPLPAEITEQIKPIPGDIINESKPFEAFLLKNVPTSMQDALPQSVLSNDLPAGTKIMFQIVPEQTPPPTLSSAAIPPDGITAPSVLPSQETAPAVPAFPMEVPPPAQNVEKNRSDQLNVKNDTLLQNRTTQTKAEMAETLIKAVKPVPGQENTETFTPKMLSPLDPQASARPQDIPTAVPSLPDASGSEKAVPSSPATDQASTPQFAELRPNTLLQGTIQNSLANEPTLITTKIGLLALDRKVQLPALTPVTIKILDIELPAQTLLEKNPLPTFKTPWTVMNHALESLKQTDQASYEAVKRILPQAGNKLPALMLSYMNAAVNGESFQAWIGQANIAALKKLGGGGETILKRLEREFTSSAKKATDGQSSWKNWDIPMLSGSVVEPVSLFLQKPPHDYEAHSGKPASASTGVRFVLELNLTRLGRMQMDGLSYRDRRIFDLTIKHQKTMPDEFEPTIRSLFASVLDALNYAGTLRVNRTNEFIDFRPEDENENTLKRGVLV